MSYPYSSIGPDDEVRMRDEHAFLARQLETVTHFAETDDRRACELVWEVFSYELENHMRDEESLLFPAFARSKIAPSNWTERLRAEHEEVRRQCRALSASILQPALCIEQLHQLARNLLEHKEREGLVLYPWLASLRIPRISSAVLPLIHNPSNQRS